MPMLHPCPRCTQMLPASAKFCRRCGAAAGAMPVAPAATPPRESHGSLVTAGLAALVAGAAIVAALLFFVHGSTTTPVVAPSLIQNPAPVVLGGGQAAPAPTVIVTPQPPTVFVPERYDPRFAGRVESHPTEQELRWAREHQRGR